MKAKNLDDVLAYRKAEATADEVSAILKRPVFGKDLELKDQLSRSSGRVGPLIAEGFGQNTDRQMADYFGRARGSALESIGHLAKARGKEFITEAERASISGKYIEISKNADALDQLSATLQLEIARRASRGAPTPGAGISG